MDNLDIGEVIKFGETILDLDLPTPPSDFLKIVKASLYICDAGTTIGTVYYPPGASFTGDLIFLGEEVKAMVNISSSKVAAYGSIQGFQAGPLTIRGETGPDAVFDFEFSLTKQHVLIDGYVELFDASVGIYLRADLLPHPDFAFNSTFNFDDVFVVEIAAELVGVPTSFTDLGDLSDLDFLVSATMNQSILDHLKAIVDHDMDVATTTSM